MSKAYKKSIMDALRLLLELIHDNFRMIVMLKEESDIPLNQEAREALKQVEKEYERIKELWKND